MGKLISTLKVLIMVLLIMFATGLTITLVKHYTSDEPEEPAVAVEYITFNETHIVF